MIKSIITVLLLMLCITSCQKPTDEPVDQGPSWVRGEAGWTENGEGLPFQARSAALRLDKNIEEGTFSLSLSIVNQFDILIRSFGAGDIPFAKGKYSLSKDISGFDGVTHALFGYMEADLILKTYYVVEQDSTNFISVDSINTETGKASGRFSVTMAHFKNSTPEFPDTLYIRNGWYDAPINYR